MPELMLVRAAKVDVQMCSSGKDGPRGRHLGHGVYVYMGAAERRTVRSRDGSRYTFGATDMK